ncbi:MAG: HAD-IA family hydrolase [Pseudomonadota bacterium]
MSLRLVVFDLDGTLVDSQHAIMSAMLAAYEQFDLTPPTRGDVLGIVGLSLEHAFARLSPDVPPLKRDGLVAAYKTAYAQARQTQGAGHSPLYPGALDALRLLHEQPETLLAIATGKSQRGTTGVIEVHGLQGLFVSVQTADTHPSKPHPSMIEHCLADAGVDAAHTVMVGDTSFDMDMAHSAGIGAIGVDWGYHAAHMLRCDHLISDFADLPEAVDQVLKGRV